MGNLIHFCTQQRGCLVGPSLELRGLKGTLRMEWPLQLTPMSASFLRGSLFYTTVEQILAFEILKKTNIITNFKRI